jgi:FAD synthetase
MKRVVITGTFDGIHKGHVYFLREAKKLGDWLGVVVALDSTVASVKGRKPEQDQNMRRRNVEALGIADIVVLGYLDDKYKILEELEPDIIALGYDQQAFTDGLQETLKKRGVLVTIVRMDAFKPHAYKSSILKKRVARHKKVSAIQRKPTSK